MSEQRPGAAYEVYSLCEELADKLKLLDYEKELLPKVDGFKIIPRHYFAQSTNVGEQFFLFAELVAWLMRKAQWKDVNIPSSNDDPNTVANLIQEALKVKGIEGNYATQKLKSGSGRQCVEILLALAEAALAANSFQFERMVPIETKDDNEEADQQKEEESHEPLQQILHSTTSSNTIKAELDRVLPQLRVTVRASDKHWKMHAEQLAQLQRNLNAYYESVRPFLAQLSGDLKQSVEKISSREKHLNEHLMGVLQEYRAARNSYAENLEKYKEASVGLDQRQQTLQQIGDEIEQIKMQIERQGAENLNGASLVKIQNSITKIERKILEMNVQIAVVEQNLHLGELNEKQAGIYGIM
uniref:Intraflagellar transport protein 57 homolog n=1 Tax=Bursaphelenchus xylophilus TaxID=6326 RepID=A0A1I7S1A8_BURXY